MYSALHMFGLLNSQEYVRAFQVPYSHLFPQLLFSLRFWFTYWFPTVLSITLGCLIIPQLSLIVFNKQTQERGSGQIWVKLNKDSLINGVFQGPNRQVKSWQFSEKRAKEARSPFPNHSNDCQSAGFHCIVGSWFSRLQQSWGRQIHPEFHSACPLDSPSTCSKQPSVWLLQLRDTPKTGKGEQEDFKASGRNVIQQGGYTLLQHENRNIVKIMSL